MKENNLEQVDSEVILAKSEKSTSDQEKQRLLDILDRIRNQIAQKNKETLSDVYISYSAEQFMENKEIKNKNISKKVKFCYKFLLLLITSIYLVGSFIIASLKKSFFNFFFTSLKCKFEIYCDRDDFLKQSNFFEYFLERLLREPIDLNLIMFWNFIGINLSNSLGFRLTSLIFLFVNFLILLLTYCINYEQYETETYKYPYPRLILIFFNWVFMAIFFGGSSLIAQQKFINYYSLYDSDSNQNDNRELYNVIDYSLVDNKVDSISGDESNEILLLDINNEDINQNDEEEKEKEEDEKNKTIYNVKKQSEMTKQRNFKSLFAFSLAILIGYTGKYGIAIFFTQYQQNNMISNNQTIYNNTEDNLYSINFFYSNNTDIPNMNDTNITSLNYKLNQNIFIYINLIYIGCILISVIFYSFLMCCFFQSKKKEKEKSECCSCDCCLWNTICEICGCVIYSERVILERKEKSSKCCRLCCETISHFCCDVICNICNCRTNDTEHLCCNCCDCCDFKEKHFEKGRQCFCYCYQEKGFCFWANKFFINDIQKEIVLCVFFCFLSRIASIGCEVKYESILEDKKINIIDEMPTYLITLGTFFIFFSSILLAFNTLKTAEKIFSKMDDEVLDNFCTYIKSTVFMFIKKLNINFIGIFILLSFNIIFGYNYGLNILFKEFEDEIFGLDKTFNERSSLYSIILFKTYLVFLINYYCLIIAKNRINFEFLFSQTILVTIYLIICDFAIYGIKILLKAFQDFPLNAFWLQFIISSAIGLVLFIIYFRFIYFVCISLFPFCQYLKGICICQICCCKKNSSCYNECCELKCSNCNCSYICCEPCCSKIYNLILKNK